MGEIGRREGRKEVGREGRQEGSKKVRREGRKEGGRRDGGGQEGRKEGPCSIYIKKKPNHSWFQQSTNQMEACVRPSPSGTTWLGSGWQAGSSGSIATEN